MPKMSSSYSDLAWFLLNPIFWIPAIAIAVVLIKRKKAEKEYKGGSYYQITKLPYKSVRRNIGRFGEYLIYQYLKFFEANGAKFLFNVYIPKKNGETSEIDVLMICAKGIFVFESKNYSGWIFGSESNRYWYQTLPSRSGWCNEKSFYNPIMQNRSHIKHLKAFLGEQLPMWSIIAFSDRCTLKDVEVTSEDVYVINRCNAAYVINSICSRYSQDLLSADDIIKVYDKLYVYTQVDDAVKAKHISDIKMNIERPTAAPKASADKLVHTGVDNISAVSHFETENPEPQFAEEGTKEPEHNQNADSSERQTLKCPRCGGELILRTATRGVNAGKQFYGCSNYPKCRYIGNISTGSEQTEN